MKFYILLFFVLTGTPVLLAQNTLQKENHLIDLNQDQKYRNCIDEVYGTEYPPEDIRKDLIVLLRDRVTFVFSEANAEKDYPLLSTLELRNEKNPEIHPFVSGDFDADTFNALRYNFNFFDTKNYQWYRIDGTDYVMIVSPYTIK